MFQGPGEAIDFPDKDRIELAVPGCTHQTGEARPDFLGSGNSLVYIDSRNFEASPSREFFKLPDLVFRSLVFPGNSGIDGNSHGKGSVAVSPHSEKIAFRASIRP